MIKAFLLGVLVFGIFAIDRFGFADGALLTFVWASCGAITYLIAKL